MSMITTFQRYADDLAGTGAVVAGSQNSAAPSLKVGDVHITIYSDPAQIAEEWQTLEDRAGGCLFQSYRWIYAWSRTAAHANGEGAAIAVGRGEDGRTLFIWPFGVESSLGTKLLTWFGHSQSNYNVPHMDPEFSAGLAPDQLSTLVSSVAGAIPGVTAVYLEKQPVRWADKANPFQQLPHLTSANSSYVVRLKEDFTELMSEQMGKNSKRSLRRKENKLRGFGDFCLEPAQGMYSRLDVLDQFYAQKSAQFREAGINDIFAVPSIRAFYRDLVAGSDDNDNSFELFSLRINDELVATFNGIVYQNRFYLLLSSLTQADYRRWSPGLVVMKEHIERCCNLGLSAYDLGAGAADHKAIWCNDTVEMIDTFMPVHPIGHLYAKAFAAKTAAKRLIKNNRALWGAAKQVRQKLGQLKKKDKSKIVS